MTRNKIAGIARITARPYTFYALAILSTFLVSGHVFFWDTVQLGAKHAHWFYENNFRYFFLPTEIDSGHPPYFGMYLAFLWKLAGKSLLVSHLAMLPFVLATIFFLYKLGNRFGQGNGFYLVLLVYADPVLAAQTTLISPDIVLVCCFLMALYAIEFNRPVFKTLAIIGLGMISLRGMMVGLALFAFDLFSQYPVGIKKNLRILRWYLPGGLLALLFLVLHHLHSGWTGYHPDSPWAASFERAGWRDMFRNTAIVIWRLLDFGRIVLYPILFFLLVKYVRNRRPVPETNELKKLLILVVVMALFLCPSMILHRHLSAHRYLLPLFLAVELFSFYLLFSVSRPNRRRPQLVYWLIIAGFLTGNCWIYPRHIAQGWDATLAHLPYYSLRSEMIQHLEDQSIALNRVGTAFPEIGPRKYRELNGNKEGFVPKDLNENEFVFYASIMNDFTDRELRILEEEWEVAKSFEKNGIFVLLYRRK